MLKGVIPVAVKVLKDQSYTSREEFQREVGLLKSLHNSNIVQFQARHLATFSMLACPGHPFCKSVTSFVDSAGPSAFPRDWLLKVMSWVCIADTRVEIGSNP